MKCTVNGEPREYAGDPGGSLLEFIRRDCGITSPKDGCSPQAACGCCAVELDGKTVLACATPMKRADGAVIRTVEGLEQRLQDALADAFTEYGGAQCGFCIPGIVMRAATMIKSNPSPTPAEIEKELRFHLCRCTGYKKIVKSIEAAAKAWRDDTPIERTPQDGRVGTRLPKYDTRDVVLGRRPYVADMSVPGMLHGAFRLADHPRAVVKSINVSKAEALDGVERVFLAKDIPAQRVIGLIVQDWPVLVAEGETTRYLGDVLACVAATTRAIAREAAELIEVEYEVLEPVSDMHKALGPDSPKVHERGNELSVCNVSVGDVDEAFKQCAHIVEQTYTTQRIEHAYMEPEACLAEPSGPGVKVWSQSQGVYEDRRQIALLLGLEEAQVGVELVPNGGGFGGKEDLSCQGQAALMAFLLQRPVHVELSREESLKLSVKRHPIDLEYKIGCDADGRLLALRNARGRRHRRVRLGRHEGPRTRSRSRDRRVLGPQRRHRLDRGLHQQRAGRGDARLRRESSGFRARVRRRRAVRGRRFRPLAVPLRQRAHRGRADRDRAAAVFGRRRPRHARSGKARVSVPPSTPASPAGSRTQASATACPTTDAARSSSRRPTA